MPLEGVQAQRQVADWLEYHAGGGGYRFLRLEPRVAAGDGGELEVAVVRRS
jgi:hypothetical protein